MQASPADLEDDRQDLMTEPVVQAGGDRRFRFWHVRMILCSEQVLDFKAKTSEQEGSGYEQHGG